MGTAFKLNGGLLFISTEAPGGVYNGAQLKKIAQIADQHSIVIKTTEDQRLGLMVPLSKVPKIATDLRSVGLGMRHYQDGLHQPVNCVGEFCPEKNQDAMATSIQLTKELAQCGALSTRLKIGINGCGTCCVPTHTLDISIIGEVSGYRISLGGKNSQIPEMAVFMAEGIPPDRVVGLVVQIVEYYKKTGQKGESLQDVMERCGTTDLIKILTPFSQDAHLSEGTSALSGDLAEPTEEMEGVGDPVLEQEEDMSFAEPEVGELSSRPQESGPSIEIDKGDDTFVDPPLEPLDENILGEGPSLGSAEEESLDATVLEEGLAEEVPVSQAMAAPSASPENYAEEISLEEPLLEDLSVTDALTDETIPEDPPPEDLSLTENLREEILAEDPSEEIPVTEETLSEELSSEQALTEEDLAEDHSGSQSLSSSPDDDMLSGDDLSLMDESFSAEDASPVSLAGEETLTSDDGGDPLETSLDDEVQLEDESLPEEDLALAPVPTEDTLSGSDGLENLEDTHADPSLLADEEDQSPELSLSEGEDMSLVSETDPLEDSTLLETDLSDADSANGSLSQDPGIDEASALDGEISLSTDDLSGDELSDTSLSALETDADPAPEAAEVNGNEADEFEQKLVASIEEEEGVPHLEDSNHEDRQAVMNLVELGQSYPREEALEESLAPPKDFSDLGIDQGSEEGLSEDLDHLETPSEEVASAENHEKPVHERPHTSSPKGVESSTSSQTPPSPALRQPPSLSLVTPTAPELELEGLDVEDSGRVVISFSTGAKFFFDSRHLKLGKTQKLKFRGKLLAISRDEGGVTVEVDGLAMTVPASEVA